MRLSRAGQVPVVASALIAVAFGIGEQFVVAGAFFLLAALFFWAYREQSVNTPATPLAAVAPASGVLRGIGRRPDPWLKGRPSLRAVLSLSLPGITTIRAPLEAKVMDYWVRGGLKAGASPEDGSPTCYTLWLQTDEGDNIVIAVHGRRVISRFRAAVSPGERVGHGHPLGFIYFGRVITLYLPPESETQLKAGSRVVAGTSVIATIGRTIAEAA
jgi:hypothetical protein